MLLEDCQLGGRLILGRIIRYSVVLYLKLLLLWMKQFFFCPVFFLEDNLIKNMLLQLMCNYYTVRQDSSSSFMRDWSFQVKLLICLYPCSSDQH